MEADSKEYKSWKRCGGVGGGDSKIQLTNRLHLSEPEGGAVSGANSLLEHDVDYSLIFKDTEQAKMKTHVSSRRRTKQ